MSSYPLVQSALGCWLGQLPRVSSGSFRFVLGRVKLFFVSLNFLHPRGWPGQVSLALLDWNIQGRIAVHLSRCCAVFISGNFDRISQLSAFVNNFFKTFLFFQSFRLDVALSVRQRNILYHLPRHLSTIIFPFFYFFQQFIFIKQKRLFPDVPANCHSPLVN